MTFAPWSAAAERPATTPSRCVHSQAAFARVTASGRAHDDDQPGYDSDLSASRLLTLADQLERAGLLELDQRLS